MPPSKHHPKSSNVTLTLPIPGLASQPGDFDLPNAVHFDHDITALPDSAPANMNSFPSTALQPDSTWQHKSTPPRQHVRQASGDNVDLSDPNRVSMGPSLGSMSTAPSKGSLVQRKDSGFRATLRRVFGSKRHRSSVNGQPRSFLMSDPGNLTSVREKQSDSPIGRRQSHSAGSATRNAPGSHTPPPVPSKPGRNSSERNRLKSPRRRRRNTLPSVILTDQEAQSLAGTGDDFATRAWAQTTPNETQYRRRSRSADALNEMANTYNPAPAKTRDRESEIAYWRTSIIEDPTPAFKFYSQHEDNVQKVLQSDQEDCLNAYVRPVNFGLSRPDPEPATVEQRLNTLEVKMFDFEFALAKIQGNDIPKPVLYSRPSQRRSIHDLFPNNTTHSTMKSTTSRDGTFLSSADSSPIPTVEKDEISPPNRSSKATTIRSPVVRQRSGAPSPSTSDHTPDRIDELLKMIKQEHDARQKLELQVAELKTQVELLRAPLYAEIRSVPYPTPSPESYHDHLGGPRALHRTQAFQLDKAGHETSRFSVSDAESDTEEGYQDVYETPRAERFTFESTRNSPMVGVH